jgi:putative endonuclease
MSRAAGWRAETLAAWWLRLKGYRILARRHATPVGEIDLIARRGRTLAFVEVKARPDGRTARHAIAPRQRRRIARAAEAYLKRRPALATCTLRFDAVLIVPRTRPRHIPNAF